LIAWAKEIGTDAVAKLLTTTLNEEKTADKKLVPRQRLWHRIEGVV
jgi:ferritin-like metal-binding protein YciE